MTINTSTLLNLNKVEIDSRSLHTHNGRAAIETTYIHHFILMEYPIHIDTIRMELSTLYLKGMLVKMYIQCCISVPEDFPDFYLIRQ